MISTEYTQDFQIKLLINLMLNQRFFEATMGQLRVEDFGTPACRLIYEVTRNYHSRFKRLPPFPVLETEILRAAGDNTGTIMTRLTPIDLDALVVIMGWLAGTRQQELDPDYFSSRVQGFIAFVRLAELNSQQAYKSVNEYITSVTDLQRQLASVGSTAFEFVDAMTEIPEAVGSARPRIGWGVRRIDDFLGGGLTRGQIGLVTACTGVGKTTTMLGVEVMAALKGYHCLFITLELQKFKIQERAQMMFSCIEAKWFKRPKSQWPKEIKDRWNYVARPNSIPGSLKIVEKIGGCTVFDLDQMVYNWKEDIARQGGDPEKCAVVAADWLDRVDPAGIKRLGKDSSDERSTFRVLEHMTESSIKHDVVWWTATQAGKSGEGKEVLSRKDTSWGQSKHHLMDASIGVAPKAANITSAPVDSDFITDDQHPNEDTSLQGGVEEPPCDRELIISFMKLRDGSGEGQHAQAYQGPTLKLWQNRQSADVVAALARKGDIEGMMETMIGHKLKGTTNAQPSTTGGSLPG